MKNLKGLKNTISSFENNKLNDLSKVNGGLAADAGTIASETYSEYSMRCSDKVTTFDSGRTVRMNICV